MAQATPAPGKFSMHGKEIISTELLQDDSVTKAKFAGGVFKVTIIDGGAAGDHTVTGIAVGDTLVMVLHISAKTDVATITDRTSEFTISAAGKINNTSGTSTTSDQLLIFYEDLT